MSVTRCLAYITRTILQAQALKTASFTSTPVAVPNGDGLVRVTLKAMAYLGTSPTMLLKLQTGDASNGSDAADVAGVTGTAASATDLSFVIDRAKLKKYVCIDGVIGGTSTPSFVVSSEMHSFKKYIP